MSQVISIALHPHYKTAIGASLRFVFQSFLQEKFLLADGKNKGLAAITTT